MQLARCEDPELVKLLDQFVCVRAIQMYGVDLGAFEFQRQLTWAAMFLNADGTIYGRYGSRDARRGMGENDKDISLEGLKKAVEGALALHQGYPANKAALAGKRGPVPLAETAEKLPGAFPDQAKPAKANEHGCVHCHQVQDWELLTVWRSGRPVPDKLLWPYPYPSTIGITLDVRERATVTAVAEGSAAHRAGFQTGDKIATLAGQPILSIADVQWVLHQAPEPAKLEVEVERAGKKVPLRLELAAGWRRGWNFANTLSLGWAVRLFVAGMKLNAVGDGDKRRLGLAGDALALRIEEITPEGVKHRNPSARKIGLKKGDVITEIDGMKSSMTETELLSYLVQKKTPGQQVELRYLRDGKAGTARLELE